LKSIYSLTVKFIEKFFSGKNFRADLDSLAAEMDAGKFMHALAAIDRLVKNCMNELSDIAYRKIFLGELNFISAIINFRLSRYSEASAGFAASAREPGMMVLASAFMAVLHYKRSNFTEAHNYLKSVGSASEKYYFFKLMSLKISLAEQKYEQTARDAGALIDELSGSGEVKLLPSVELAFLNQAFVRRHIETALDCESFLYKLLYIAAEANFNAEIYATAFEYYKEASFSVKNTDYVIECNYKMASCKIRLSDFVTARELLESAAAAAVESESPPGAKRSYRNILLDLANLYEFFFDDKLKAIEALNKYVESGSDDQETVLKLSRMLYDYGRINEALTHLNALYGSASEAIVPECALLIAECYYALEIYRTSVEVIETFIGKLKPGEINLIDPDVASQLYILAAKNYIMTDCCVEAEKKLDILKRGVGAGQRIGEQTNFSMFLKNYSNSVYFLSVFSADKSDASGRIGMKLFKGFVLIAKMETDLEGVSKAAVKFKNFFGEFIVAIDESIAENSCVYIYEAFGEVPVIFTRYLKYLNEDDYEFALSDNPLSLSELDCNFRKIAVLVWLLNRISVREMPELNIPLAYNNEDEVKNNHKTGLLKLYDLFARKKNIFKLPLSYIAVRRLPPDSSNKKSEVELWPFIIDFKNIDLAIKHSDERERCIVNGSEDIFIYNYLREGRNHIDGGMPLHFFVESYKIDYFKEIIAFILKKLSYVNDKIAVHSDVMNTLCIKKINSLLASGSLDMKNSYTILSLVLSIGAGHNAASDLKGAIEDETASALCFSNGECDYENCPEKNSCKITSIIKGYESRKCDFHISPCPNYFFINRSEKFRAVLSGSDSVIFSSVGGFYHSGAEYHSVKFDVDAALKENAALAKKSKLKDSPVFGQIEVILYAMKNMAPDFFESIDMQNEAIELLRSFCVSYGPLTSFQSEFCPELEKLYSAAPLFSKYETEARAICRTNGSHCEITFYAVRWINEVNFDRNIVKLFFINPEDSQQHYEKKFGDLFKFFKRLNISEKYFELAMRPANLLILPENQLEYKSIIMSFISGSKRSAVFYLNSKIPVKPYARAIKSDLVSYYSINMVSDVEPFLINLDCVIINYHFQNQQSALAMLSALKNVIIKYNVNIFWMVVSTDLFDAVFSSGSAYNSISAIKFFPNEIEYFNSLTLRGKANEAPGIGTAGEYFDLSADACVFDKISFTFKNEVYPLIKKSWDKIRERLNDKKARTYLACDYKTAEALVIICCVMLFNSKFKRHITIYSPFETFIRRAFSILSAFELKINPPRREKSGVFLLSGEGVRIQDRAEKIAPQGDSFLITFQPFGLVFNALDFNVLKYEAWMSLCERYDDSITILALPAPERVFISEEFQNVSKLSPLFASKTEQFLHSISENFASYEEAFGEVALKAKENAGERHVFFCPADRLGAARSVVAQKFLDSGVSTSNFSYIAYERGLEQAEWIFKACDYKTANAYFFYDASERVDAALLLNYAKAFAHNVVSFAAFSVNSPAAPQKVGRLSYAEVCYMDAFLADNAGKSIQISLGELSQLLPTSAFSRSSASACLAIFSKCGKISLREAIKEKVQPAGPIFEPAWIEELAALHIIYPNVPPECYPEKPLFISEWVSRGFIEVIDYYELIDRIYSWSADSMKVKINLTSSADEAFSCLKRFGKLRKTMIQCLFDMDGFKDGAFIPMPALDFQNMSQNDFYFMREFCFLKWHSICDFSKNSEGSPTIKRVERQVVIDLKTERLTSDLLMLFEMLIDINAQTPVCEIVKPGDLLERVLAVRKKRGSARNEKYNLSYLLRLLKHLFLYGLVNYSVECPLDVEFERIVIEIPSDYKNIDYKEFQQARDSMINIEAY